ncbi:hypothetical protein TVAG_013880 [Trichomonas vaginalis G3]|uniref:Transmembrane protein n=1 Tax=Trichomonas vaginalis (strain ATCC PRA-98 / G3) TaxID=412133 RepID=A2DDE3_TRIV3|nr:hypothetical protein TVAGG3_0986430 [Trichomonas vaginalis G3]EAY21622.1 hypothetical protein TVAG_013880 [Trichomonas vaginalis G3]KAI5489702.1 hypothetical protein TVAGG3_0986430 [Trichomonas vaginalis G3]|eukprot:XP_001582608.1 hypothetical protein [Trichomonas vaginalis G3]
MKSLTEHNKYGFVGNSFFWIKISLIVLPIITLIYSILIAAQQGNGLFKKSVGTAPIACHILLLIFCIASICTAILYNFHLLKFAILSYVHYIVTAIGILFAAICLMFLSPAAYYSSYNSVSEYANQFSSQDPQALTWVQYYNTTGNYYDAYNYVLKRTLRFYNPMKTLFALWLGVFFFSLVQGVYIDEKLSHETVEKEQPQEATPKEQSQQ